MKKLMVMFIMMFVMFGCTKRGIVVPGNQGQAFVDPSKNECPVIIPASTVEVPLTKGEVSNWDIAKEGGKLIVEASLDYMRRAYDYLAEKYEQVKREYPEYAKKISEKMDELRVKIAAVEKALKEDRAVK